jgi:hypothetical protein
VTGVGGRLKGARQQKKWHCIAVLGRMFAETGRLLLADQMRLANVPYDRLALSTYRAKSFNGQGRKQMELHQCGILSVLSLLLNTFDDVHQVDVTVESWMIAFKLHGQVI